jgi:putative transposase
MERFDPSKTVKGVVTQESIPPTPPYAVCDQLFDMRANDVYQIFDAEKLVFTSYQVEEWVTLGKADSDRLVRLKSPENALVMHLSNWQIAHLQSKSRIVPVGAAAADGRGGATPGYALSIKGKRKEKADWYLLYVDVVFEAYRKYCKGGRSRKVMERAVLDFAEQRKETPPSLSTLYDKLARLRKDRGFDSTAAVADRPRRGNQGPRKPNRAEEAVRQAVLDTVSVGGDWNGVKSLLAKWSEPGGEYADLPNLVRKIDEVKPILSDRAIQRRLAQVDHYTRDSLIYGEDYAERLHADRIRQLRPDHPLDIVDVDHTTLNIVVFGEGISFGRPDLVLFRDRYSGVILGWALSFGPPSYETFLEGLLHAMSPKEHDNLPDGVIYRWHGRPFRLGVDNAKHLLGFDIHSAARQLGMQTVKYRPGHPWEKGALEHLFQVLGVSLVERLPGSTAMSPEERMKFDEERLMALPQIDIAELNGFLAFYFAEIYHREPHEGLGPIPTLSGVPEDLWVRGKTKIPPRPVQDQGILVRLAGHSREVGISAKGGIRWGNIEYQSAAASALRLTARHKHGQGKFHGTKYRAVRDPADLSRIWIEIPWEPERYIEVPVAAAYVSYATGLTAYQHKRIQEHHRQKTNEAANAPALMKAKAELAQHIVDVHAKRRKHGTALKLARFVAKQAMRIERARPVVVEDGTVTSRLDLANPARARRLEPRSPLAKPRIPVPKETEVEDGGYEDLPDDGFAPTAEPPRSTSAPPDPPRTGTSSIDDIAARNEEWDD